MQRVKGVDTEGIGLTIRIGAAALEAAQRNAAIEVHCRSGKRIHTVVGLLFAGKLYPGTDIVADCAGRELRGQVGLVSENFVAHILGIDVTCPGPGVDVIWIWASNVRGPPIIAVII